MSNLPAKKPWLIRDLFYVIALMWTILLGAEYLLHYFGFIEAFKNQKPSSTVVFAIIVVQWIAMLGPLYLIVLRRIENFWAALGFNNKLSVGQCFKWAIAYYLLYFLLNALINIVLVSFDIQLPGYQAQQPHLPIFGSATLDIFLAVLVMVILAPIIEEIFFRGFILNTLVSKIGTSWGNFIAALIFAGIHFEFQSILGLLLLAVILNALFIRTGSIWPAIIFHILNNAIALAAEYYLVQATG